MVNQRTDRQTSREREESSWAYRNARMFPAEMEIGGEEIAFTLFTGFRRLCTLQRLFAVMRDVWDGMEWNGWDVFMYVCLYISLCL